MEASSKSRKAQKKRATKKANQRKAKSRRTKIDPLQVKLVQLSSSRYSHKCGDVSQDDDSYIRECFELWASKQASKKQAYKNCSYELPWAILRKNKLVAIAFVSEKQLANKKICYLERIITLQQYRNRGYFKFLIDHITRHFYYRGCNYFQAFCDKTAWPAYEKLEFETLFEFDDYNFVFCGMLECGLIHYTKELVYFELDSFPQCVAKHLEFIQNNYK